MNENQGFDDLILYLGGGALVITMIPLMVPKVLHWAAQKLLELGALVPEAHALVRIPGTTAGLDAGRILALGGALLLVLGLIGYVRRPSPAQGR